MSFLSHWSNIEGGTEDEFECQAGLFELKTMLSAAVWLYDLIGIFLLFDFHYNAVSCKSQKLMTANNRRATVSIDLR